MTLSPGMHEPGGGAVEDHVAGTAGDDVGLEARAVVDVEHVHLLVLADVGELHQAGVERDRPDVVEIGTGDGGPVDLRLHHDPLHQWSASCIPDDAVSTPRSALAVSPRNVIVTLSIRRALPTNAASATSVSAVDPLDRFEGRGVDDLGVVEPHQRRTGDGVDDQRADGGGVAHRRGRRPPTPCRGRRERMVAAPRSSSVEVGVAARQRETVGLADERAPHDLDREVEIGGHAADDRELLRVLAAEVRAARTDDREQLGHDRGHAVEVAGPAGAAQAAR